jgi:hypothetical protein
VRDYAQIRPRFWTHGTGKDLRQDRDARLVAVYLMSCPNSNMIGLYYLPIPTIAHELAMSYEGASKALRRVSEAGFCRYDEQTDYVWVINMAREQIAESLKPTDNRIPGIIRELEKHTKSPFFREFIDHYASAFCLDYSKFSVSPLEAPSKALRSQEQEQEQEEEEIRTSSLPLLPHEPEGPATKTRAARTDPVFAHWVEVMGKGPTTILNAARKAKLKARRAEGYTDAQLCQAVDGCKLSRLHMGKNDSGEPYNDLATILKDGTVTEKHIERAQGAIEARTESEFPEHLRVGGVR